MKKNSGSGPELVAGQLWEIGEHYIEIVAMGKTVCHFRELRNLRQKGVPARLMQHGMVQKYLAQKKAKMIGDRKTVLAKMAS